MPEMSETQPISEPAARHLLLAAGSPAHDPARYRATRLTHGWAFSWSGPLAAAPLGASPWQVDDDGTVHRLGLSPWVWPPSEGR